MIALDYRRPFMNCGRMVGRLNPGSPAPVPRFPPRFPPEAPIRHRTRADVLERGERVRRGGTWL